MQIVTSKFVVDVGKSYIITKTANLSLWFILHSWIICLQDIQYFNWKQKVVTCILVCLLYNWIQVTRVGWIIIQWIKRKMVWLNCYIIEFEWHAMTHLIHNRIASDAFWSSGHKIEFLVVHVGPITKWLGWDNTCYVMCHNIILMR